MTTLRRFTAGLAPVVAIAALPAKEAKTPEIGAYDHSIEWTNLPSIPDKEGFAGSFAGSIGDTLIFAGGANFPDARPWEGGTKTWYDKVFILEKDAKTWREAGKLPAPSGYGLSLKLDADSFLMIGGGDARENSRALWKVTMDKGEPKYEALPELPIPLILHTGGIVESKGKRMLYIIGGQSTPHDSTVNEGFYGLNLDAPHEGWTTLPSCPGGGRLLATAAVLDNTFYMFGGARLRTGASGKIVRERLKDAWSYRKETGWVRIADMPRISAAGPNPAATSIGKSHILIPGGDDNTQAGIPPTQHKGFPRSIMAYYPATDTWVNAGNLPLSVVVAPLVPVKDGFVIPGGEPYPGTRSTEVWKATIKSQED